MSHTTEKKKWSCSAGVRGQNRVRAFAHPRDGQAYLEYSEAGRKRRKALGHTDHVLAAQQADQAAEIWQAQPLAHDRSITLGALFDIYEREVSPQKGRSARGHDRRAVTLFLDCWGADRPVHTLSLRDWNQFIRWRREHGDRRKGGTCGQPIGNRVIVQNLKFMSAVLNWAVLAGDRRGNPLLNRNPLKGLKCPKELGTRRPFLVDDDYERLLAVADDVHPLARLALVMAHETGHRISAILGLRWSDLNLLTGLARWRAENDKIGLEHSTPLSAVAVEALQSAQRARAHIGDGWVFPAPGDAEKAVTRHLARDWWQQFEAKAGLVPSPGRGWHSLRRKFATELKHAPLPDVAMLGGWRGTQALLKCYQHSDPATLRRALDARQVLHAGGLEPRRIDTESTPRLKQA